MMANTYFTCSQSKWSSFSGHIPVGVCICWRSDKHLQTCTSRAWILISTLRTVCGDTISLSLDISLGCFWEPNSWNQLESARLKFWLHIYPLGVETSWEDWHEITSRFCNQQAHLVALFTKWNPQHHATRGFPCSDPNRIAWAPKWYTGIRQQRSCSLCDFETKIAPSAVRK